MARQALVLAFLAICMGPAPARAATATLAYEEPVPGLEPEPAYTLSVRAASGEANRLTVSGDADGYTVQDSGAAIEAGEGCEPVTANEVRCLATLPASSRTLFVDAGDRADQVGLRELGPPTTVELRGGAGDDLIIGGPGRDLLLGGSGADAIAGGAGSDRLDGGRGDDRLFGGEGSDRLTYQSRKAPVTVDLAAATGGASGETDELAEIEEVVGGRAADEISGDEGANTLIGAEGEGRDTLSGRGGDDVLIGYRLSGGEGNDNLDGRKVSCGGGEDMLYRGLYKIRGPFSRACETVLAVFVIFIPDPVAVSRREAVYEMRCRYERCSGRIDLRDGHGRLGTARFSLRQGAAGEFARIPIRLSRRPDGERVTLEVTGKQGFQKDRFRTRLR